MHGSRHAHVLLYDLYEMTVQVPILDPVVVAIADQQERGGLTRVQPNAVTSFEFSFLLARPAKGFHEFAIFIKLEDIIRSVSVGDKDRTIRPHCDRAGLKSFCVFVDSCFLRKLNLPIPLAIQFELNDFMIGWASSVDVFNAILVA